MRFADGSEVAADVVIFCTGYKVSFPFFEPGLIAAPGNDLPLFRRVFHPDMPDVFFVGLLQPLGAVFPLAEIQAEWICDYLSGRYELPPEPSCGPTWRPSGPRSSPASSPPSGTRWRSTSRTTCSPCARSGGAASGGRRMPATGSRCRRAATRRSRPDRRAATRRVRGLTAAR